MKKGGKMASCGCSVKGDGVDTDIFKSFTGDMMKDLQKFCRSCCRWQI